MTLLLLWIPATLGSCWLAALVDVPLLATSWKVGVPPGIPATLCVRRPTGTTLPHPHAQPGAWCLQVKDMGLLNWLTFCNANTAPLRQTAAFGALCPAHKQQAGAGPLHVLRHACAAILSPVVGIVALPWFAQCAQSCCQLLAAVAY